MTGTASSFKDQNRPRISEAAEMGIYSTTTQQMVCLLQREKCITPHMKDSD